MDEELIKKYALHLERASWCQVFLGMMTQVSSNYSFPSYNIVLGFWGAYCAFSKHDLIFCAVNGNSDNSATFKFALTMLIFCLVAKLAALYSASHFFSAIGGAYAMNNSYTMSAYDSMVMEEEGRHTSGGAYYNPPDQHVDDHRGRHGTPLSNSHSASDIGPRVMLHSSDERPQHQAGLM